MWRSGRLPWPRIEDPSQWVSSVSLHARVIAITGTLDDVTSPRVAIDYVNILKDRGIAAIFNPIDGGVHNGALRSPEVMEAVGSLLDMTGNRR
jgi:hypothetical protein